MNERLFEKIFNDGVTLLTQAKNYMTYEERKERESCKLSVGLRIGYAQTIITARILHSLTFLLGHKAVMAGELDAWELEAANWTLGGGYECIEDPGFLEVPNNGIPKGTLELLAKTKLYYMQVARLEKLNIAHLSVDNYNHGIEQSRSA